MGKFDKYLPVKRVDSDPNETNKRALSEDRDRRIKEYEKLTDKRGLSARVRSRRPANFAIALDATASMSDLIENAKASIGEILRRIANEAGNQVRVRLYAYRDYDVPNYLLEFSDLTHDPSSLVAWLANIIPIGGGANSGEAIEVPLEHIFRADDFAAVMIAGDEPPNPKGELQGDARSNGLTALEWAGRFSEMQVPIHTFVVGSRSDTKREFRMIAQKSGGQTGQLDGSDEMIDMAVMAMLSSLKGKDSVRGYMDQNQLSENSRQFGTFLIKGPEG